MNDNIVNRVYVKHEKEKAKLKFCDGWTFNLSEIPIHEIRSRIDSFMYVSEKATYKIDASVAIEKGFIRNFKGETKLVIPGKYWTITQ